MCFFLWNFQRSSLISKDTWEKKFCSRDMHLNCCNVFFQLIMGWSLLSLSCLQGSFSLKVCEYFSCLQTPQAEDAIKEKGFNFVDKRLMSGRWRHEPNPEVCKVVMYFWYLNATQSHCSKVFEELCRLYENGMLRCAMKAFG